MPKFASWLTLLTAFAVTAAKAQGPVGPHGVVPDARTAEAIAEAVLVPVMGEKAARAERPYRAALRDGVWTVAGAVHCRLAWLPGGGCKGGVATVVISQQDGRILSIDHG